MTRNPKFKINHGQGKEGPKELMLILMMKALAKRVVEVQASRASVAITRKWPALAQ